MSNDLSDNQRRAICRTLFLVLCALPTCVTIYFATHQRTPDQWAQLLQAELGVHTSIGDVETPLPDELVIRDLKLFDNDGRVIFESLGAKVFLGNTNRIEFSGHIEVTLSGMSELMDEVADRLVMPQPDSKQWEVKFNDIVVLGDRPGEGFGGPLHVNWFNGSDGRSVHLKWPLRENPYGQYVDLHFARNAAGGFSVKLDSPEGFLPCWVTRYWFPDLESKIGPNAGFAGVANIDYLDSNTTCVLNGMFNQVQLSSGITRQRGATAIYANGVWLEDSEWTNGAVSVRVADKIWNLNITEYLRHSQLPQEDPEDPFDAVVRTAMHGEYETSFIR